MCRTKMRALRVPGVCAVPGRRTPLEGVSPLAALHAGVSSAWTARAPASTPARVDARSGSREVEPGPNAPTEDRGGLENVNACGELVVRRGEALELGPRLVRFHLPHPTNTKPRKQTTARPITPPLRCYLPTRSSDALPGAPQVFSASGGASWRASAPGVRGYWQAIIGMVIVGCPQQHFEALHAHETSPEVPLDWALAWDPAPTR